MATITPCPNCRTPAEFSANNPFRPFCSERCQLIDLGEWFNEERRIPSEADAAQSFQSADQIDDDN